MIVVSVFYVYLVTLCSSVHTITMNTVLLIRKWTDKRMVSDAQMEIQYYCIMFYMTFAGSALVHSGYMVYGLRDPDRNREVIFWTGALMFSCQHVIGVGNTFVALDRLVAMLCPAKYRTTYGKRIRLLYLTVVPSSVVISMVIYVLHREKRPGVMFGSNIDIDSLLAMNLFNAVTCLGNIGITVAFLITFMAFVKRQNQQQNSHYFQSAKKANHLVIYQMLLEGVIIIIPTLSTTALHYSDAGVVGEIGPYPQLLLVLYTSACSILYTVKLNSANSNQVMTTAKSYYGTSQN